ncbi:hypothetical protein NQ317_017578 [Molorchus minor]|uniref:Sodium/potassium-transporting ATPase subunit beta-1 n=1 Tax=Molorchus minor TaxID=1323400 RepID=A0ABQ9JRX1_9CUCU|nr:hypothetical protein NQ317_017578 [Molorchus minor]
MYRNNEANDDVIEFQLYRPETLTRWQRFRKAMYNPSSRQILGRTPKQWGQLALFYSVFYLLLVIMFLVCMQVLFSSLDPRIPTWILDKSLIGDNPGLGYRPMPIAKRVGTTIQYNLNDQDSINHWVDVLDEFLVPYKDNQSKYNFVNCDFDNFPGEGDVCTFTMDTATVGNCVKDKKYGYTTTSPCVFLKLNRIFSWIPEYYSQALDEMPDDLQEHIKSLKTQRERHQVWVTCKELGKGDGSHLKGFTYSPRGFPQYYYPYRNYQNYLSPIVAVEILELESNISVRIECRAWARNIRYHGGVNREGSVAFEIQVDL